MNELKLGVNLQEVLDEIRINIGKGKSTLLIGTTSGLYARSVNMKNGSFDGYAMYAGFSNKMLKVLRKKFGKYEDVKVEFGKGWVKLVSISIG